MIYNDLLNSVAATIASVITGGAQISIRKLPAVEETLDTLPAIIVSPKDRPEEIKRSGFENNVDVIYTIEIVIVDAGNFNFTANLPLYLNWRQQLRYAFQQVPISSIPNVYIYNVVCDMEVPIDRTKINELYDYVPMAVRFWSSEINT